MTRKQAIRLIDQERDRQLKKWGVQRHKPEGWLSILGEEFGEVAKEVTEMYFSSNGHSFYEKDPARIERYKKEVIQVAAVAVAMLECLE